ncbi:MAG: hypothetical protein PWQ67_2423 [Clostridia bacterium]|jgi:NTP pyrophosphatase (non-canonical NTP hydrolase)|nr:hypothetical protein [Clostridia bacterium]MDN5323969.1 hypothetical protein [Clostridia bacterium]
MDIKHMQKEVDEWISQFQEGYWQPSNQMVKLIEEVGELAREINHYYGQKPKKISEPSGDIALELGDILFVIACLANTLNIDLTEAFIRVMEKYKTRDKNRWTPIKNV